MAKFGTSCSVPIRNWSNKTVAVSDSVALMSLNVNGAGQFFEMECLFPCEKIYLR